MKKTVFALLMALMIAVFALPTFAEEAITTDSVPEETILEENVETDETLPDNTPGAPAETDNSDEFLPEVNEGMIDKLIALGEELKALKESDYTFEERMMQLINSENLAGTIGTLMTVISSIAIFVFRSIQKRDYHGNAAKITALHAEIESLHTDVENERKENVSLREDVNKLISVLQANTVTLEKINIDTTENREIAEVAKTATTATAKMVADAFGHSRTIDASTKELITYDYLEVLKAGEKNSAKEE